MLSQAAYECEYVFSKVNSKNVTTTWPGWSDPGTDSGTDSVVALQPSGGEQCGQSLRLRGVGTQNYICAAGSWVLSEPMATLHQYATDNTVQSEVAGFHYFSRTADCKMNQTTGVNTCTAGGGAGWKLGSDCGLTSCATVSETFSGSAVVGNAAQAEAISWLLVSGAGTGADLGKAKWLQRLETLGGVPSVATYPTATTPTVWGDTQVGCTKEGEQLNVPYECDYIFASCGVDAPVSKPAYKAVTAHPVATTGVALPSGQDQVVFTHGVGTQNYYCGNSSSGWAWTLMNPRAWLHNWVGDGSTFEVAVSGYHYFNTVGSVAGMTKGGAPGWSLGRDCGIDSCNTTTDMWTGSLVQKAAQAGAIAWLLVEDVTSSGPTLGGATYLQRLATVAGSASPTCSAANGGETYQVRSTGLPGAWHIA